MAALILLALPPGVQAPPAPPLREIARSGFEMKGTPFSRARLAVDPVALRRAMALPGRPGEAPLDRALRLFREGKVPFHIFQSWEISVSGARRKEFNLQVLNGNFPGGVPSELRPAVERYLNFVTRDVDQGMHWEFEGGGGRPVRSRYNGERWVTLGDGPMFRLLAAMYLDGPDTLPGTRVDFRAGLKALLERTP